MPINSSKDSDQKQDIASELKSSLEELREALEGKRHLQTLDSLIDEL